MAGKINTQLPMPEDPRLNESLFNKYIVPHIDGITRYINYLEKNPDNADEILNDVLLRAYRFINKCNSGTDYKSWLIVLSKRTRIDYTRARTKVRRVDGPIDLPLSLDRHLDDPALIKEDDLVDLVYAKDLIRKVLSVLPSRARKMLELRLLGHPAKEIGAIIGCPASSVDTYYTKYTQWLRENIHQQTPTRKLWGKSK